MDELLSQQKCQSFNILSSPDRPEHVMRCPYIHCQSESALGRAADEEARARVAVHSTFIPLE